MQKNASASENVRKNIDSVFVADTQKYNRLASYLFIRVTAGKPYFGFSLLQPSVLLVASYSKCLSMYLLSKKKRTMACMQLHTSPCRINNYV